MFAGMGLVKEGEEIASSVLQLDGKINNSPIINIPDRRIGVKILKLRRVII